MISNQSREKVWEACPRKYFWQYVCDLEPKPAAKAFLGVQGHAALAAHYRGDAQYIDVYTRGISAAPVAVREADDYAKLAAIWAERLRDYPGVWAGEDRQFEVVLVPEAEIPLAIGEGHVLMTRADLIVRRRDNGSLWVMDHKFATRTGSSWWAQFAVDKQGSAYTLAAEQLTGEPVAGWMINAIKPTKTDPFERQAFARSRAQLESFRNQTLHQIARRVAAVEEGRTIPIEDRPNIYAPWVDTHFPQHTGACHGFGNCPFLGVCAIGAAAAGAYARREPDYVDTFGA